MAEGRKASRESKKTKTGPALAQGLDLPLMTIVFLSITIKMKVLW